VAWNAIFAPKGTPKPIVDTLAAALDKALDDANVRTRLFELGSELPGKDGRGPQALAALVKSEIARWTPIIKAAGPINWGRVYRISKVTNNVPPIPRIAKILWKSSMRPLNCLHHMRSAASWNSPHVLVT